MKLAIYISLLLLFIGCIGSQPITPKPIQTPCTKPTDTMIRGFVFLQIDSANLLTFHATKEDTCVFIWHGKWHRLEHFMLYGTYQEDRLNDVQAAQRTGQLYFDTYPDSIMQKIIK